VTDLGDGRAATTRQQILRAAAQQLARTPYSKVNLDDILAQAGVTKGALLTTTVNDLFARQLSGLETLNEISIAVAVQDSSQDVMKSRLEPDGIHRAHRRNGIELFH
jgi:hypothetical protein